MNKAHRKALQSLMQPVRKVPMEELLPGMLTNPQQAFAIIVGEGENQKIINTCSDQYHLLPNKEIIEPLLEILEGKDITFDLSTRLDARFSLDIIFKDNSVKIGNEDIHAKIRLYNSYDGRVKFSFHMGFFRFICTNGLTIPLEGYEDKNIVKKIRHMPLLEAIDRSAITDMVESFNGDLKDFAVPYQSLQKEKISIEALPELLTSVGNKTKFPVRQLETVVDTLQDEMNSLGEKVPNKWLIYNAFNYQLNHSEEINMDAYKKEDIDRQVIEHLIQY